MKATVTELSQRFVSYIHNWQLDWCQFCLDVEYVTQR